MLITDRNIRVFDLSIIQRGDCIRARLKDDPVFRNGFVTQASESRLQVIFPNVNQGGNATSFMNIPATEVADGLWEIWWTKDFITLFSEGVDNDA